MTAPTRPHRLTIQQFHDIAAGRGDAEALDGLWRAQLSKRLLLLREVRFRTDLAGPPHRPVWSLLDEAMSARPDAVREVLARPFVDAWACRVLRRDGRADGGDAAYLAGLALAAGIAAGVPFEQPLPDGADALPLPGLGRLHAVSPGTVVRYDGEVLRVATGGPARTIRLVPGEDQPHWAAYRAVRCEAGAWTVAVELDDLDPYRSCFGLPVADRLSPDRAQRMAELLRAAVALIGRDLPDYLPTVRRCLRAVVPVDPPETGSTSASNQNAFGAVAISLPADAAELALLLVHETQHGKLGALLDLVDLTDPASDEVYHAPWRADPRPAAPLLQGVYAHAAVADFWRVRRRHLTGAAARTAEFEYAFWRSQARRAADTLLDSRALTDLGRSFVAELAAAIDGWRDGDVEPAVRATVSACAVVTDVDWRLRNHRVTAAQVADLLAAYRSGQPCPPVPPPEVVPGGVAGAAMAGSLVRRLRQRATAPTGPDDPARDPVTPSCLDGRLGADPHDAEAWALLILALAEAGRHPVARAVRERPELVREVMLALVGAEPGNAERVAASQVAAWLVAGLGTAAT
jgi:uncharacterized protein